MSARGVGSLSLRARLTLWYSVALLLVLALFAAVVVWQQGRIGMRRVDRELDALAATLDNVLRDELAETGDPAAAAVEATRTIAASDHALAVLDARGDVLGSDWRGLQVDAPASVRNGDRVWTAAGQSGGWRVHVAPTATRHGTFHLLVAAPLNDVRREQREAEEAMSIGIPIALVLAAAGGLWLASIGLGPITGMARRAEALAPGGVEDLGPSDRGDELGQLARADAGGYPLRREHVYLNEIAADCARTVDVLARARGVTVNASAAVDVPFCGDESLLRRMILNLLQNAVVYTREGSAVAVEVSPNGRHAYVRVTDQGEGIPEADRARVFDRFVQLDAARRGAGAGLGLPIARWIAEAHGGTLDLEESGSAGSTFRIVLPTD